MHITTMPNYKAFKKLLSEYGLERDSNRLWLVGVYSVKNIDKLDEEDLFDYGLKGTWAQYCFMYKQETGEDHKNA